VASRDYFLNDFNFSKNNGMAFLAYAATKGWHGKG
jgi:hypothetical protein